MRGIELLKKHKVPFHAIAVITADALDQPDAVFNFFKDNEIHSVGFNIEEQEGIHQISTVGRRGEHFRPYRKISPPQL